MKEEKIYRLLGDTDDDLILRADKDRTRARNKTAPWYRISIAACLCLAIITVFAVLPRLNSVTPPTPGGEETPVESTPVDSTGGTEEIPNDNMLSDELIAGVSEYLRELYAQPDAYFFNFHEKLDSVKYGTQMLHVKFDPDNYYFVCLYSMKNDGSIIDISFNHPEKYIWMKFDNETDIPKYYRDAECIAVIQVNKTELCRDSISDKNSVPTIEYFLTLTPEFENGYNTTQHTVIDDMFIYLNDSDKDNVYYDASRFWIYKNKTIPCIELDGDYYITHPIDYRLGALDTKKLSYQFGAYYDYLMDVMITDKYSIKDNNGYTTNYGLFKLEDILSVITE